MNRLVSLAGKTMGSLLLLGGGVVSTGMWMGIAASHATGAILALLSVLWVFWGLTPAVLGGWLLYTGFKAERRAIRSKFFQLLQAQRGRLSVLEFALATHLEPTLARRHLDRWAVEFSANFEVSEEGEVYYLFTPATMPVVESQPLLQLRQVVTQIDSLLQTVKRI